MELVRSWARRTSTALGAALLLPGAVMIVAAGVAVGGGGLGGIGALGQLVEGPRDPLAALAPGDDTLAANPSALIAASPSERSATERGGIDGTSGGRGGSGGEEPRNGNRGEKGGDDDTPGGDDGGSADGPGAPVTTAPTPKPEPGPLEPVGEGPVEVTGRLPGPVGPLSGEAIDQVVDLGEDLMGQPDGGGKGLLGSVDSAP